MQGRSETFMWLGMACLFFGLTVCFTILNIQNALEKDREYEEGKCIIFPFEGADGVGHTITIRLSGDNICVVWGTPTPTPVPTPTEVPVALEFDNKNYGRVPHPRPEDFWVYPRGDILPYTQDAPSDPYYYRKDNQ